MSNMIISGYALPWDQVLEDALPGTDSVRATIGPLVALLRQELQLARLPVPGPEPEDAAAFARWYLEVVQLLEAHLAAAGDGLPMVRSEVELMCRCTLSARTLREAIELCGRYCAMLHPRAGRLSLECDGSLASVQLDSLRPETTTASSLADITGLFAFRQLFQWLVGADLRLRQVRIGPIERDDVLPFLLLFGAPVIAGGEVYSLDFPRELLDLPVMRDAPEFAPFFSVFPCNLFAGTVTTLSQQVAALLGAAAQQGTGLPTQAQMAATLGLSHATLRRRLAAAGSPYRELRVRCLRNAACEMLRRGDVSLAEVSSRLGFSDVGAFRRAFRQWTGTPPTAWRESDAATTSR